VAAFAALVRRHGPMVLAVCRAILRDPADAEDAFQATFLVLVRRAAVIRDRTAVGEWLYSVAGRAARRLRATTRRLPPLPEDILDPHADTPELISDIRAILDEEVARLPEVYRLWVLPSIL
jgi:RNA polymerase sigma factor (sigma-70 family)